MALLRLRQVQRPTVDEPAEDATAAGSADSATPQPPSAGGRIPDFFVVGHVKSGTTALYEMLAHHAQVFVGLKEPRYFATELRERDIPRPAGNPSTLEQYMAWFERAGPQEVVGDVSPEYLWSRTAAALIAQAAPQARIIAILREPASFLHSLHRQWLQLYVESETSFEKAMALDEPRREGRRMPTNTYWPAALIYSEHVRYVEQLRRYHAVFAPEQVLVLIYEEYRRDNETALREILRFIGVEDTPTVPGKQVNSSVYVRSPRLNGLLRALSVAEDPLSRAIKKAITTLSPMRLRQRALHATRQRLVFGDPDPSDERFMRQLRIRYRPEVEALSEYLGRDMVRFWAYDKLD
jgi:hypothetical protein